MKEVPDVIPPTTCCQVQTPAREVTRACQCDSFSGRVVKDRLSFLFAANTV